MQVKISEIKVPEGRKISRDISSLAESIGKIGLINPVTLSSDMTLLAGLHRLEACKSLGFESISARVTTHSGIYLMLVEIDENLIRHTFTVLERGELLRQRKICYEDLFPEARNGGDRKSDDFRNRENQNDTVSFCSDTAEKTGLTERAIQRDIMIAENITEEAKHLIRGSALEDSTRALQEIARIDPELQVDVVARLTSGQASTVSEAKASILGESVEQEPDGFDLMVVDPMWDKVEVGDMILTNFMDFAKSDSIIMVWATSKDLKESFLLIDELGLTYRQTIVWNGKVRSKARYTKCETEFCIVATKGNPKVTNTSLSNLVTGDPVGNHIRPESFYQLAEAICEGKKADIFAKYPREGWSTNLI
jgi:hypothetical protein